LVLIVAIAGGVLAYVLVSDTGSSGGSGGSGATGGSLAPTAADAQLTATSFDPLGDGTENPDAVGRALDQDPTTSWRTEQYDNFPDGRKDGVGLAFDLNGEYDVKKVIVQTQQNGWGASIYVSDKPASSLTSGKLADWVPVRGADGSDLQSSHTFETGGVKARSVLLWLTHLPAGENGKHYVDVTEVKVA
jgi:hypothetical protein